MSDVNLSKQIQNADQKVDFRTGDEIADSSSKLIDEYHSSAVTKAAAFDKAQITPVLSLPEMEIATSDIRFAPRAKGDDTAPPPVPTFSKDFMDNSVSPRQDFMHYADGQWIKDNPIPNDRSSYSGAAQLSERNQYQIKQLLENAQADKFAVPGSSERRVGDFYASAMNTDKIEKLGLEPVKASFEQIDSIKNTQDLFRYLADSQKNGFSGIFGIDVQPDAKESTVNALQLGQGGLSLPDRDYYLSDSFANQRSAYQEHITKMFELEGKSPEQAAKDAATVLAMETEFAKASRSMVELRDPVKNYNKTTIDELAKENSTIPWKDYLNELGLSKAKYAIVGQPEFFKALEKMMKEHPVDDFKTLLHWQLLSGASPFLSHEFRDEHFNFFGKTLDGRKEQAPRWKSAQSVIDGAIGEDLGKLFVEKYFPPESKQKISELVNSLLSVYGDRLKQEDWMSEETRQKAIAKLNDYTTKVGYPDKFRDYSGLEIKADDYYGNVQRASAFEAQRRLSRIGQPVDRSEWDMTPQTINAYYSSLSNEIVFPAGILQPPFFDPKMDDAVNYGAIGAVIGHEITHGFDDEGRHFDGKGNLNDWWTDEDAKKFSDRAQKLVDEYDHIEALPGLHVNGKLTLGENMADLGGIKISYDAMEKELDKDPSKRKLIDGLTPEQRFFIAFAQTWRSNTRDEAVRNEITSDPHSPSEIRAYAPLVNLPEFYAAFGIQPGDPMWRDPSERANIW